ncbi:MAG: 50S ribosomal protein L10 [Pseudomonadota bacterium]
MNRQEKVQELQNLTERFQKAKALIFADYRKLKVSEMNQLRSELRKNDCTLKVIKNRLAKKVLEQEGLKDLEQYIDGPTALATTETETDIAGVAKALVEFAKDHEFLKLRGGLFEGKIISFKDIDALAKLPSREVLLGRLLAAMNSPATNLACVLNAVPQKLVRTIDAIRETKK